MTDPSSPPPVPPVWSAPPVPGSAPMPASTRMQTTTDVPTILTTVLPIVVLLLLLVAQISGSMGFPSNAPVEQVMAFGISVDLVAAAIALGVRAAVIAGRTRAPYAGPATAGAFAVTGIVLAGITVLGFLGLSVVPSIAVAVEGGDLRYMGLSSGMVFLGIPWVAGVFFSAAAYRPGRGTRNSVLSLVALGALLVVAAATVAAAIAYGAGLTE